MNSPGVYHKLHKLKMLCTKDKWIKLKGIAERCLRNDNMFGYKECVKASHGKITSEDRHLLRSF